MVIFMIRQIEEMLPERVYVRKIPTFLIDQYVPLVITYRTWCRMRMWGPLFKYSENDVIMVLKYEASSFPLQSLFMCHGIFYLLFDVISKKIKM